jgi:hypothetical protein
MTAPQDPAGRPPGWPSAGAGSRAAALKLIGGLEKHCGHGIPMVLGVTFMEERIDLRMSSGQELSFTGLSSLKSYVATCTAKPGTASDPAPDPEQHRIWEQWWEMLLDLSGYPTYFQDLHPGLEVIIVRRHHRQALITVGDGTTVETYRVALDEDVHYPVGIPDDIRYSFNNDMGPPALFAQKIA